MKSAIRQPQFQALLFCVSQYGDNRPYYGDNGLSYILTVLLYIQQESMRTCRDYCALAWIWTTLRGLPQWLSRPGCCCFTHTSLRLKRHGDVEHGEYLTNLQKDSYEIVCLRLDSEVDAKRRPIVNSTDAEGAIAEEGNERTTTERKTPNQSNSPVFFVVSRSKQSQAAPMSSELKDESNLSNHKDGLAESMKLRQIPDFSPDECAFTRVSKNHDTHAHSLDDKTNDESVARELFSPIQPEEMEQVSNDFSLSSGVESICSSNLSLNLIDGITFEHGSRTRTRSVATSGNPSASQSTSCCCNGTLSRKDSDRENDSNSTIIPGNLQRLEPDATQVMISMVDSEYSLLLDEEDRMCLSRAGTAARRNRQRSSARTTSTQTDLVLCKRCQQEANQLLVQVSRDQGEARGRDSGYSSVSPPSSFSPGNSPSGALSDCTCSRKFFTPDHPNCTSTTESPNTSSIYPSIYPSIDPTKEKLLEFIKESSIDEQKESMLKTLKNRRTNFEEEEWSPLRKPLKSALKSTATPMKCAEELDSSFDSRTKTPQLVEIVEKVRSCFDQNGIDWLSQREKERNRIHSSILDGTLYDERLPETTSTVKHTSSVGNKSQAPSLFYQAAATGDLVSTVQQLKLNKNLVHETNANQWPSLHVALSNGHLRTACLLIEAGADVESYTQARVREYQKVLQIVDDNTRPPCDDNTRSPFQSSVGHLNEEKKTTLV